jgi:hypothetical protein
LAGVDPANMAPSPMYGDLLALRDARLGAILPFASIAPGWAVDRAVAPRTRRSPESTLSMRSHVDEAGGASRAAVTSWTLQWIEARHRLEMVVFRSYPLA